jgi:ABC-2 type transport system permease protein
MSTQSNAITESRVEAVAVAPAAIPPMRLLYWSVRRELWEYRSIYLAPLATAGVFLFGFLITAPRLADTMRKASAMAGMPMHEALAKPYDMASGFLMAIAMFVGAAYCLGALYNERRDRSILFWKSLPVSDVTAVLAKACIPLVILPLVTVALTVVLHFVMLLIHSAVLAATGQSVATLWAQVLPVQMWFMLLYHLIAVHSLWHSPFYGWMLLVSSWAKRAAFLWATLPVLAIGALERLLFNTSYFFQMLGYRLSGDEAAVAPAKDWPLNPMTHITPGHFLLSPGLWTGLIFTALCLAGAVRMRRYRSPL